MVGSVPRFSFPCFLSLARPLPHREMNKGAIFRAKGLRALVDGSGQLFLYSCSSLRSYVSYGTEQGSSVSCRASALHPAVSGPDGHVACSLDMPVLGDRGAVSDDPQPLTPHLPYLKLIVTLTLIPASPLPVRAAYQRPRLGSRHSDQDARASPHGVSSMRAVCCLAELELWTQLVLGWSLT